MAARGHLSAPGDHSGRGRWDHFPVIGRAAGVLASSYARLRPAARLEGEQTHGIPEPIHPPLDCNFHPAPSLALRPRRLSLFGPPICIVADFAREVKLIPHAHWLALKAFVKFGQGLNEPIVPQPAAPPAEQPPAPSAAPTPERLKPAIGTGLERAVHRTPQRREEAPQLAAAAAEEGADTDVLLQRLINAASPAEPTRLQLRPKSIG